MVAILLLSYAVLTGAHPAALRSALTIAAVSVGLVLRRQVHPANTFALSFPGRGGIKPR